MEYLIQVYGKTSIENPINPDKEFSVAFMRVAVDKEEEDKTNSRITYKVKSLDEVIIKEGETVIKSKPKKKGSQSQVFYNTCYRVWEEQFAGKIDFDDYYIKRMLEIIREEENKLN